MKKEFFINMNYHIDEDRFKLSSNIDSKKQVPFICDFLQSQIDKGFVDMKSANKQDEFSIFISTNPNNKFVYHHDCGNEGLLHGILMEYLSQVNAKETHKHEILSAIF